VRMAALDAGSVMIDVNILVAIHGVALWREACMNAGR